MNKAFFIMMLGLILWLVACSPASTPTTIPVPAPTNTAIVVFATATRVPNTPSVPPSPTVTRKGGTLVEAVSVDAKSFHPFQTTDAISRMYQDKVYASGLWVRDPKTLQPIPGMAESWSVSSDGRVYTFNLRKDMKWSDGSPITSNDYEWTFIQANKLENKYPYLGTFDAIAAYKVPDDYLIQVQLKEPLCTGLTVADAVTPLPQRIWQNLDWSDPTKNPQIQNPTVTSGPFKLKEWKSNDLTTFVRNDTYYRGAPNLDSYIVRVVPNPSQQLQLLKQGQLDVAPVSITDYADAKKSDNLKLYEWDPELPEWDFIGFNLRRAFLKDVAVRQALSTAMPRQKIVDQVFQGLAKPMYSTVAPTSWAYNPDVPRYDYNIDTAKSMLQQAGYKTDPSGKLLGKDGKPLPRLKIFFNLSNDRRKQIAMITQEELKKLGIDSDIIGMEFEAYIDYLRREPYDYDLFVLGWRTTLDPYFSYQLWSEASIPALNFGAYVNSEVEKLYEQANRPPCDTESRKKVFQQIQKTISTDAPYIFLAYHTGYAFLNKRVVPNDPSPLGISYFPEQWYLTTR